MPLADVVVKKAAPRPTSCKLSDERGLYLLVNNKSKTQEAQENNIARSNTTKPFKISMVFMQNTSKMLKHNVLVRKAVGIETAG